jgi:hypothetical protein
VIINIDPDEYEVEITHGREHTIYKLTRKSEEADINVPKMPVVKPVPRPNTLDVSNYKRHQPYGGGNLG